MNRRDRSYTHFLVVAACLCFVYLIGVTNLKSDPIKSFSEWNSLRHVSISPLERPNSIPEILASVEKYSSQHGPLYFLLMRIWQDLVGPDLLTYRLLSVFFGLLTLAIVYRLALITRDRDTALDAALFAAFHAFSIYFIHEARMYSLLPMLVALVVLMYWKVVSSAGHVRWWQWIALALSSAAIIYVHYFGIVVLGAIGLYHLLLVPKNKCWLGVCLAMLAAGALFLPWLPVALDGLTTMNVTSGDNLSLIASVFAMSSIYTNGLPLLVPVVVAAILFNVKQLGRSQKYVLFLSAAMFLLMLVANEFSPVIIARRIRYTIVLAIPWTCTVAIGLSLLPWWRLLRLPILIVWIVSFFVYTGSDELSLYTNEKNKMTREVAHYEDFVYQTGMVPRPGEPILSFHPFANLHWVIQEFYTANLPQWKDLVHIHYDDQGELEIESEYSRNMMLAELEAEYLAFWVIHNPQRIDMLTMEVYRDWFLERFQLCKRYLETEDSIIEYYVAAIIPCELLVDDNPFTVSYDNGTELGNIVHEMDSDVLKVYMWWDRTHYADYSLTLQIFNRDGTKVQPQVDAVINGSGLDTQTLDISSLPEGDYVVKLIVYDRLSLKSQSGVIVDGNEQFEREVEIIRFSVDG